MFFFEADWDYITNIPKLDFASLRQDVTLVFCTIFCISGPCCIKQSANLVLAGMLRARQRRGCVCCIKLSQIASPHARLADLRSSFLGTQ